MDSVCVVGLFGGGRGAGAGIAYLGYTFFRKYIFGKKNFTKKISPTRESKVVSPMLSGHFSGSVVVTANL